MALPLNTSSYLAASSSNFLYEAHSSLLNMQVCHFPVFLILVLLNALPYSTTVSYFTLHSSHFLYTSHYNIIFMPQNVTN